MKMLTQTVLAAALAAMMALCPARGAESEHAATPAVDQSRLAAPEKAPLKLEPSQPAPLKCTPNWTGKKFKPFAKVQNEVRKRYGNVRILRVALCGEGTDAYFQIVVISDTGTVSRVQIAASN